MEKCAFRSKDYANGCSALKVRSRRCRDCSFYKTPHELLRSKAAAADLYLRRMVGGKDGKICRI